MSQYFKIYLQRESDGAPVMDTISTYGMYCMENPFKTCGDVKDIANRSWHDEHGDDEYISEDGLYLSSYENKVKFGFKGNAYDANERLKSFLNYLRSGMLKMYCEFNQIGRQHVRFKSVNPTLYREVKGNVDILTVEITFKFNDPITDVEPDVDRNGAIINLRSIV